MFDFNATFLVAMFSFVVFIIIMNSIFYAPILNIIRKRNEYIEKNYTESKEFEVKAEEFKQTHAQKIKETQDICRQDFKQKISQIQEKATEEVRIARENSKNDVKTRKEELFEKENLLKSDIQNTIMDDLATAVTNKIISEISE